jgi:hypothetical protein
MIEVRMSETPIRATTTGPLSPEYTLDFGLQVEKATLVLRFLGFESPGTTPTFALTLETALDPDTNEWFSIGKFDSVVSAGELKKRDFDGILRFVRGNVTTLTDATAASFMVYGVAR